MVQQALSSGNNSGKPSCTVIMYHYIRDTEKTPYPEIKALSVDKFKRQIDYVEQHYKVISLSQYLDYLEGKGSISEKSCILTFDDGLIDHYTVAFPVLKSKKMTGAFFPITLTHSESRIPCVLKVQFLLAKIGAKEFASQLNSVLRSEMPDMYLKYEVDDRGKKEPKYRWDDNLTANLKYAIGNMPEPWKTRALDRIFPMHFHDEKKFAGELCMTWDQMREMQNAGMVFGGHTHTHPRLADFDREMQKQEIAQCTGILQKNLKAPPEFFSYPYGSFNDITIELLKLHGYRGAITTDLGVNPGRADSFKILRMDTNDVNY